MIARFRRHRWLTALLVFASPAVSGQVLPVLHPCPVDAPWLAAAHAGMVGMPGMANVDDAAATIAGHSHAHHECTCLGHSSAPAIAASPQGIVVAAAVEVPRGIRWPLIEAGDRGFTQVDRLPEKTAPPQA